LYEDAIKLSDAAIHGYPGGSPRVMAILKLRAAQAHAHANEASACQATIDSAYETLRDNETGSGSPRWAYWLDEAQANEMIGTCFLGLTDWTRAREHFSAALRLQDDPDTREGALRRAKLALAYARQGEPERACAAATMAVGILAADVDSQRCVGHVRKVQAALGPYRKVAAVAEFNEHVDRLLSAPA
jgi:tetratricopeptide (TPR) repeat protein